MPEKDKRLYTGAGALTGLAVGLLLRKLTAPKRGVGWKDYATWGGLGAGLGGLTGYGLATPVDQSKHTEEQTAQLESDIKETQAELDAVTKDRSKYAPGLIQALWAPVAGFTSGITANRLFGFSDANKKFTESLAKIKEEGAKAIGKAKADLATAGSPQASGKAAKAAANAITSLEETKKALKGRWYLEGAGRSLRRTGLPFLGLALGSWINKNELRDWYKYADDKLKLYNTQSAETEELKKSIQNKIKELNKGKERL